MRHTAGLAVAEGIAMEKRTKKECRKSPRRALVCPVTLYSGSGETATTIDRGDLSDGGVYLAMSADTAPNVGSRVEMTFCLPRADRELEVVAAGAKVIRRDRAKGRRAWGVAMRFTRPIPVTAT
jgi:hypothetical protein